MKSLKFLVILGLVVLSLSQVAPGDTDGSSGITPPSTQEADVGCSVRLVSGQKNCFLKRNDMDQPQCVTWDHRGCDCHDKETITCFPDLELCNKTVPCDGWTVPTEAGCAAAKAPVGVGQCGVRGGRRIGDVEECRLRVLPEAIECEPFRSKCYAFDQSQCVCQREPSSGYCVIAAYPRNCGRMVECTWTNAQFLDDCRGAKAPEGFSSVSCSENHHFLPRPQQQYSVPHDPY